MSMDKPEWMKRTLRGDREKYNHIRDALRKRGLVTVCEEASCPNIDECWSGEGTATFMIMGDTCTRGCGFCDVNTGAGEELNPLEPGKIASAIQEIGLDYAVITSVDRDDLPDQGAMHFADTIRAVHNLTDTIVEVLIPDFQGDINCIETIVDESPSVIAHNLETVERLQGKVRDPRAGYQQSLSVLESVKQIDPSIYTKSSLMLGLGENEDEVYEALRDMRDIGVDIVTLGQYLKPSKNHLDIDEYIEPEIFEKYKSIAEEMGFKYVASGPFVRSSYRAGELFIKNEMES